jgi:SAM-dependent methyltransferase
MTHDAPRFECRLCGAARGRKLFDARDDLQGTPGVYSVIRCLACGLRGTHPVPADASAIYHEDYAPHQAPDVRPLAGPLKKVFDLQTTWIPDLPAGAPVLELGCGTGGFLSILAARGLEVHGVEPAAAAAERAKSRGARVVCGTLREARYPDGRFAAVFAWMVLEHLPDLRSGLREIARVLSPGGWFAFSVPNAGAWEFSFFRDAWYALQVPAHVSHFGIADLSRALGGAGLALRRVIHQRNVTSIVGSLGLRFGWPALVRYAQRPPRIGQAILYPLACALAAIRQGGRLTCIARKEGA